MSNRGYVGMFSVEMMGKPDRKATEYGLRGVSGA